MTTPVTSTTPTPTAGAAGTSAMAQLSSNFSTFLTLLTTQLKNQDPTSPMDSNQFTQQLVMYSQVEQQIDTNTNLKSLIAQGSNQAGTYASSYLGKTVSVTNGQASLTDGAANWTYTLGSTAASANLIVTNSAGRVVFTGPAETASGSHAFAWDGKDNNGNVQPDGTYKLSIAATDSAGNKLTTSVVSAGKVGQIDLTSGTPQFVIGNMEIGLGDIGAIGN
ncbi:MAG: flagellar hook assembly protein FlgD [Alphaproteobacteria bacterium]|nr:flagellar hook assembly protein FlgD [Alphaproteobacteria bacterium]